MSLLSRSLLPHVLSSTRGPRGTDRYGPNTRSRWTWSKLSLVWGVVRGEGDTGFFDRLHPEGRTLFRVGLGLLCPSSTKRRQEDATRGKGLWDIGAGSQGRESVVLSVPKIGAGSRLCCRFIKVPKTETPPLFRPTVLRTSCGRIPAHERVHSFVEGFPSSRRTGTVGGVRCRPLVPTPVQRPEDHVKEGDH